MRLLNSFLFSSLLIGQTYNLPFDWSGQFGISTVGGRLFWNSDWTSGPLLFDGTYTHYPVRYGNAISALFQPAGTHLIPLTIYQLPDTTSTTTILDYERGDYNYDRLAIDADFKTPRRSVGLHGFKRSYAGREGQFFHPKGNTSPLQQTFKVDYRSENKGWLIDASTARLVTELGLPDSGAVNGLLEDEILTAGIITRSPGEKLQWTSHFALFQQWRRIDASWYGDRKKQFISRRMWKQELDGFNIEGFADPFVPVSGVVEVNLVTVQSSVHNSDSPTEILGIASNYGRQPEQQPPVQQPPAQHPPVPSSVPVAGPGPVPGHCDMNVSPTRTATGTGSAATFVANMTPR